MTILLILLLALATAENLRAENLPARSPSLGSPPTSPGAASAPTTTPLRNLPFDGAELERVVGDHFGTWIAERQVPGGAFALVQGAEIVMLAGFGQADLENGIPVDPEATVFRVGSNSKTVTALAAMQAVEAGELALHEDVSATLGWPIPETFPEPITLHHLLTHTSGLVEELLSQHRRQAERLPALDDYLRRQLPRRAQPPGRVISYNDHGTSLVGSLVEEARGVPFADSVHDTIFDPLGMRSSGFDQVRFPASVADRLARAYRWEGERHRLLARDFVVTTPAAGLFTTASDMARFLSALLEGGELDGRRVLSRGGIDTMLSTRFRHGDGMPGRAYGLVERELAGRRALVKDGQCSGFTARIVLLPEEDLAWFSVVNLSIFGRAGAIQPVARFHRDLATAIGALLPNAETDREPSPAPRPALVETTPLSRLTGVYRETSDPRDTWESLMIVNQLEVGRSGGAFCLSGSGYT